MDNIELWFRQESIAPAQNANQTKNKAWLQLIPRDSTIAPPLPLFSISHLGHKLLPPAVDNGSDIDVWSEEEAITPTDPAGAINREVDTIW